jgi:hypothetical protein
MRWNPGRIWSLGLIVCVVGFSDIGTGFAFEYKHLAGRWSMPDTNETLIISQSGEWFHPKYGRGKIRFADTSADIVVNYEGNSVKCFYRIAFGDSGATLILATADTPQSPEYCPVGRLKSVNR